MDTAILDIAIFGLALPITTGLVYLAKQAGFPARWAGLLSVAVAIVLGVVLQLAGVGTVNTAQGAITGLIAGLSASGAWSGVKSVTTG